MSLKRTFAVSKSASQPSARPLLQSAKLVAQAQVPFEHTELAGQALPQAPQLAYEQVTRVKSV
jgi:hypothetical protein